MKAAIETVQLTKNYGKARGITQVDLQVQEGEIFGFIGPNGAGKSTTIRTLLGLLHKTSGQARIFGMDCETQRTQILEQVGYLPSEVFYYDNMLHLLGDRELLIEGYVEDNCVATTDQSGAVQVLAANPGSVAKQYDLLLCGLAPGSYQLTEYYVDEYHNNWITDHSLTALAATKTQRVQVADALRETIAMAGDSFCLFTIKKAD